MSDSRRSSGSARRAAGVRRASAQRSGQSSRPRAAQSPKGSSRTGKRAASAGGASRGTRAQSTGKRAAGTRSAAARRQKKNFLNYPRAGAKNPWRWIPSLRMIAGALALMVLAGLGFAVWLYNDTDVPAPSDFALAQSSRVYYADGETEMGRFSEINRTEIPADEIPENIKQAVVASEDSTFYENRGISPRGIVRALINNLSGGARQGGSTITQQYVERYHTGTNTSYLGKMREMVMALKIDQELSKEEILARYLNTIYFGRGAYGVQEAAQAYFNKDAKDLTDAEAALLVAVIPAPSAYDPANDQDKAVSLWDRVITRQVNLEQMTPAEGDALEFPETAKPSSENELGGTKGYLLVEVRKELLEQGFTEEEIDTGGFTIISTIDKEMQKHSVEAIKDLPDDRPKNNRVGTMTLDPATGAIRAMYGGPDYVKQAQNDATQSRMQAGSIFKTFTLIAALQDGYPLDSLWQGNSPQTFDGGWEVNNFANASYGTVTLERATASSINTAYAQLNLEIGPQRTRDVAVELGLPEDTPGLTEDAANVLGSASPTVGEMAEVYATLAAGGVHRERYIVESVTRPDGSSRYEHEKEEKRAMDQDVATNATVALQGPPTVGSARKLEGIMGGRPVAGKTGTSEKMRSAWFVGFTPQLVTAVAMFQPGEDGSEQSLAPFGGEQYITGSTWPTSVWGQIMSRSLEGQEFIDFAPAVPLDNEIRSRSQPSPQPQPTQAPPPEEEEPSEEPTEEPTEEEPTEEEPTEEEPTEEEPTEEPEPTDEPEPTEEPEPEPTEEQPSDPPGNGDNPGRGGGGRGKPTEKPTAEEQAAGIG
ncbi:transglycosylase domain-containing protein [Brachybacterium sp. UMB0905]|uniref:transglycosylase domain-containing protein n=1 Tax=Brachybacterium sp. UMB0905 TaxID=2069310 RepID=UPI000C7FF5EC|nr:transglycosylase domain-containing protein [Brachybacterium sp. UMB0905]PMC75958.1 penicillin-binding protein [Brachybacterium sp. UMB0905]